MSRLQFSGHETFACRHYWLKKGYDFVAEKGGFREPDAVVELGVGKNMVTSIRYWLKAFDILDDKDELTDLAQRIFNNKGWDPFLEDDGTLWLLHYKLHKKKFASIYNIIFSELRKQKPEFTRKHFFSFVDRREGAFTERTLRDDFSVFSRTYLNDKSTDVEDGYSGLLADLNLLRELKESKEKGNSFFTVENKQRPEIPSHIIFYAILDNERYGDSISFDNLYSDADGIGTIFALNKEGVVEHLDRIAKLYKKNVIFNNDPLVREFQFKKKKPTALSVLREYYGN